MFAAFCETHDTEVLLSERRIFDIEVEEDTVTTWFVCWCGTEGSFRDPRLSASRSASDLPGPSNHVLARRQLA